jgi:DNA-nicking Smr family endonuclease
LFRQAIGNVQTIKNDKVLLTDGLKPKPYPKSSTIHVEERLTDTFGFDIEHVGIEDTLNYTAAGIQHAVLKKLRKGKYGLDAEIDLHGLNSHEAKQQLHHFLRDCVAYGCRCVHIVHGKGYRSADNHPVLKNELNVWLRQHNDVQAFCSAPPKDGGAGAVYVLLQLSKE